MDAAVIATMQQCTDRSLAGTITFPEVVARLTAVGCESYRADFYRREKIYFLPSGESYVSAMSDLDPEEFSGNRIAQDFAPAAVIAALRAIQSGEIDYRAFLAQIAAAGTVAYSVHLRGRRAIYFGRTGEFHVEDFPPPAKA